MVDDAPTPPEATPDEVESLPKAIGALFADLPGLLTDRVRLLAAILFATAWITLWIGLAEAFLAVGLKWPWIVLLVLFVNLSAAIWAVLRVKALAPLLALPATLRRLTDSEAFQR